MVKVPFRHLTGHISRTVSLKREGRDRVMISGGWRGRWDAATGEGATLPEAVAGNLAEAVRVYPELEGVGIDIADAGHQESMCIDGLPIIDTVPGVANLWYATGWCGHGWAIAPVICELIANWAARGRCPSALRPFSNRRFA
jgi:sarcosine oxidase subunit beta